MQQLHHEIDLAYMRILFLPCWLAVILFNSCYTPRYSYAPTRVNAPMLQQKGELQANGSISALKGFDASAAYAISSHFGAMLNSSWRNDHQSGNVNGPYEVLAPDKITYHRTATDLGVGWFTRIDSSKWTFEIYGAYGRGKFSIEDTGNLRGSSGTPYFRYYDSKVDRIILQPAVGHTTSNAQFIFFVRILGQRYFDISTTYTPDELERYRIPQSTSRYLTFIEPGLTFRFYLAAVPALGFETNFLISRPITPYVIESISAQFSAGIHLRFQQLGQKK